MANLCNRKIQTFNILNFVQHVYCVFKTCSSVNKRTIMLQLYIYIYIYSGRCQAPHSPEHKPAPPYRRVGSADMQHSWPEGPRVPPSVRRVDGGGKVNSPGPSVWESRLMFWAVESLPVPLNIYSKFLI